MPEMIIIRHIRLAWWIIRGKNAHQEYVILTVFHHNYGYAKAPDGYVYKYLASLV